MPRNRFWWYFDPPTDPASRWPKMVISESPLVRCPTYQGKLRRSPSQSDRRRDRDPVAAAGDSVGRHCV